MRSHDTSGESLVLAPHLFWRETQKDAHAKCRIPHVDREERVRLTQLYVCSHDTSGESPHLSYRQKHKRKLDSQALNDTEGAETKIVAEDGEETVEEGSRPPNFRHDEDDDLENDEQPVEDGPERSRGLVGHGAAPESSVRVNTPVQMGEGSTVDVLDVVRVGV